MSRLQVALDAPGDRWRSTADFWSAALGWAPGPSWSGHPELRSLEPRDGTAYVHLQDADTPPRVHLDVETADRPGLGARLVSAGARPVSTHARWDTYRSPGGLPFCLVDTTAPDIPSPAVWPDGHRSRLVQVCVDAPSRQHDAEVAFWRGALGGRWTDSPAREFAGKWHDDAGSPLQLLFQRLDEDDGDVRAHLDLGTDDQPAEVERLLALGALDVGPGPGGWHVLRDPADRPFCVTLNSPEATVHRDLG